MEWINNDRFRDANDPALFEVILNVQLDKELVAFVLEPADVHFANAKTRFHLFATTGVRVVER